MKLKKRYNLLCRFFISVKTLYAAPGGAERKNRKVKMKKRLSNFIFNWAKGEKAYILNFNLFRGNQLYKGGL